MQRSFHEALPAVDAPPRGRAVLERGFFIGGIHRRHALTLTVKAGRGEEARVAAHVRIAPPDGYTAIVGTGPAAAVFEPSVDYQVVGAVPCEIRLTFNTYFRPWELVVRAAAGASEAGGRVSSEGHDLPRRPLVTPDTYVVVLKYDVDGTRGGGGHA